MSEWLRLRMANMRLEERTARERNNTRHLPPLSPAASSDHAMSAALSSDVTVPPPLASDVAMSPTASSTDVVAPTSASDDVTAPPASDDVMETDGDVTGADVARSGDGGGAAKTAAGDARTEGDDGVESDGGHDAGDDVTVTPASCDVTQQPYDVIDDASALDNASIVSVRASPVPADVSVVPDDVTLPTIDDVTVAAVDDVTLAAADVGSDVMFSNYVTSSSSDDDDTTSAEVLREKCRRQRLQLRGLKRRLAQLQRENTALRMRTDGDTVLRMRGDAVQETAMVDSEAVQQKAETVPVVTEEVELDPAAIVEDLKQAAAETAAQLAPSGFVYQEDSGLYFDHDSGYYWDPRIQMYYDGTTGYYLRYDESTGSYVYVEQAAEETPQSESTAAEGDNAGGERTRRRASGEELEDGEIEDDEEEEGEDREEETPLHWSGEEYWTRHRRQAQIHAAAQAQAAVGVEHVAPYQQVPTPAVIESGPRSPLPVTSEPPWLRMIVTETKLEDVRVGSLHVATMDGLTVGRDPSQQLCLNDTNLSKFHAVIVYRAETPGGTSTAGATSSGSGGFYIRDLGSRNGTFVDDRRISAAKQESEDTALPHGALLRLGGTCLVCHVHAANDTCLDCEPGHTRREAAPPPSTSTVTAGDARQQRLQVAKRIKQKYGLRPGDGAAVTVAPGYSDRAAERRLKKGSAHHSEKTHIADVRQPLPVANKGFKLLQQMGWKEGSGLGRQGQGRVEPVLAEERADRAGLGCDALAPPPPAVGKKQKRRTEVWQKTQDRFNKL